MSNDISKLSVHLTANSAGLVGGLKQGEHELEHFGEIAEHVHGILEKLPEALAAVGIGFEIFEAFKLAGENEQAMARLGAVVKATGEAAGMSAQELGKMAEEMSETTLFEKSAITAGEAVLATFTQIKGTQFKEAMKAAADLSTVMGTDLKESVIQIGKALNDPAEGYTALKRAGVSFTDSQIEQIKTLQDNGDMLGAQNIILHELGNEFGGAAQASTKTFTGQITQAKKAIEETTAAIAEAMLPAISSMARWLKDAAEWAKHHKTALAALGTAVLSIVAVLAVYQVAMVAIKIAQMIWNAIQVVTLALQGPKGWATLAGAVAVAATGITLVAVAQAGANSESEKSDEAMSKATDAANKLGTGADNAAEGVEKIRKSAKELKKDVQALTERLKEQIATFGMSAHEAEVYKLKMQGVKDEQLKEANALAATLDQMEKHKKEMEAAKKAWEEEEKEAKKIIEESRDPYEKLEDSLAKINKLEKERLLTAEQAEKASEKAADEFEKTQQHHHKHPKEIKNSFGEKTAALEIRFTRGFQKEQEPLLGKIHAEAVKQTRAEEELVRQGRNKKTEVVRLN